MQLLRILALAWVAILVARTGLAGQATFAELDRQLHRNDRIRITVAANQIDGVLVLLNGHELVMTTGGTRSTFQCPQIQRIDKRGDPIWTGAAIGAAIAAVPAWNGCQNKGPNRPCVALGMATVAAIGGLLDKAHVHTRTVYVASPRSCGP